MKTKVFKVTISVIVILGIVTAIFLYFYKFPKEINIISPAVSFYENDPSSVEGTTIKVSGTLYRPLFQQHVFEGSVTIDNLDFTKKNETLDTYILDRKNGINMGNLVYHKPSTPGEFLTSSMIWFDDTFEHVNIASDWGQNKKLFFIVSASSYEEGIDAQRKMRDKYGSFFVPRE
ncbi:hypothetical protein ACN9MH_19940 [Paenibacillus silvae]|uniref:hypothetical protein n=1 Tax=Paenibacillus silvae TaxID=1325358 RepID=UPI0025A0BD06|nr:hypothetical protein [Paenibacillus silvae]MDM5276555.1 hypothetical protein [Paenibacillus silvae]